MAKRYLFVWEGIWADHTSGIAFALANNIEDAHAAIAKKFEDMPSRLNEIKQTSPIIISVKDDYANGVSGGG